MAERGTRTAGKSRLRAPAVAAALVAVVVTLAACSSANLQVDTEYDPDSSFEGVQTFAWLPEAPPDASSNRPMVRRIVEQAIERELEAQGYVLEPFGDPDIWVAAIVIAGRTDVRATWDFYGYGGGYWLSMWAADTNTSYFQEGTLIVDLLDRDRRVRWRGIATGAVESGMRAAEEGERVVGDAVARMFAEFPPN
ncbi:MAG: DUF4136 domain-containing protein [Gemmatimonadota bacterium]|nr:DUF4136 domain-containing protein [Gemmatimonadota bacterium]